MDTIRFYEKKGLIKYTTVTENNYRHYDESVAHKLTSILQAKALGFSLREIRELSDLTDNNYLSSTERNKILDDKIMDIDEKIHQLEEMKNRLLSKKEEVKKGKC